jgi:hypothetical protein
MGLLSELITQADYQPGLQHGKCFQFRDDGYARRIGMGLSPKFGGPLRSGF